MILSHKEAAELLHVTPRSIYRWIEAGKLTLDDLTPDRLARPSRQRDPHCSTCGTRRNLVMRRGKPAYECKECAAERMYRARH